MGVCDFDAIRHVERDGFSLLQLASPVMCGIGLFNEVVKFHSIPVPVGVRSVSSSGVS